VQVRAIDQDPPPGALHGDLQRLDPEIAGGAVAKEVADVVGVGAEQSGYLGRSPIDPG
jgi:hypothetical protein